jgi:hypothetical protein
VGFQLLGHEGPEEAANGLNSGGKSRCGCS